MHEKWQALIPFYVAGVLSEAEANALRDHLAGCSLCRRELDEWAVIGDAVVTAASDWSKELPPLSQQVRTSLHTASRPLSNGPARISPTSFERDHLPAPQQFRHARGGKSRFPLTLVASIIAIIAFVGLVIFVTRPGNDEPDSAAPIRVSPSFELEDATLTATPDVMVEGAQLSQDLGILPVATDTITATPTPLPPRPTATSYIILTPPAGVCTVVSASGRPVNIYRHAGTEYPVTGTLYPGEFLQTYVYSENGWYEVVAPGGGLAGWVSGDEVNLNGPCSDLLLPTPTYVTPAETPIPRYDQCVVRSPDWNAVNMRTGPGLHYDIINAFGPADTVTAIARTDDGWYRIRFVIESTVWIGWVFEADVVIAGTCDQLVVLDSAVQTPETVPSPQATPTLEPTNDGRTNEDRIE